MSARLVAIACTSTAPDVAMLPVPRTAASVERPLFDRAMVSPIARMPTETLSVSVWTVWTPLAVTWTPPEPTVP